MLNLCNSSMHLIDTLNIHRYHTDKIEKYGHHTPRALGWTTPEAQTIRFDVLSQIADLTNCSVLDAGCGHGDLCAFLNSKFTGIRYFGVDCNEGFLEVAIQKQRHITETAFFYGDFMHASLPVTDYILLCGSLNYRNSNANHTIDAIATLFKSCRIGLGFNMLSAVDKPQSFLISRNPTQILEFCKTIAPVVVLIDNYLEGDFTIFMYH